jgi:hypothetical protein
MEPRSGFLCYRARSDPLAGFRPYLVYSPISPVAILVLPNVWWLELVTDLEKRLRQVSIWMLSRGKPEN